MNNHDFPDDQFQADDLTWREQEVLVLLAKHQTNREIADQLHLAESTVKDYVSRILSKLYVKNRRQAVERAKELGLLESEKETFGRPPCCASHCRKKVAGDLPRPLTLAQAKGWDNLRICSVYLPSNGRCRCLPCHRLGCSLQRNPWHRPPTESRRPC